MDEDWHATCQAKLEGVKGSEWETMCYNYKDMHKAVRCKTCGKNKKAKALVFERSKGQRNRFL